MTEKSKSKTQSHQQQILVEEENMTIEKFWSNPNTISRLNYQNMLRWMLQVIFFAPSNKSWIQFLMFIIQILDQIQVSKDKKHLSRLYLNKVVCSSLIIKQTQYQFVVLACVLMAQKTKIENKQQEILNYQQLPFWGTSPFNRYLDHKPEINWVCDQILILNQGRLLNFTPLNFLYCLRDCFSCQIMLNIQQDLENILQLCLSVPDLVIFSVKQVFFGVMLSLNNLYQLNLGDGQNQNIRIACKNAEIVRKIIQEYLEDQSTGGTISIEDT